MPDVQGPPDPGATFDRLIALCEPARRDLYFYVAGRSDWVSRSEAVAALDLRRGLVAHHLDRLADDGLLKVEYRRPTGRSGPGTGRPAKLYRRGGTQLKLTIPPRNPALVGQLLTEAIARAGQQAEPVRRTLIAAAHAAGADAGHQARSGRSVADRRRAFADLLVAYGYAPHVVGGELSLASCPYEPLAGNDRDLVCGMNLALVEGAAAGGTATRCPAGVDQRGGASVAEQPRITDRRTSIHRPSPQLTAFSAVTSVLVPGPCSNYSPDGHKRLRWARRARPRNQEVAMRHLAFRPSLTIRGRTFKGLRGWSGKPLHPPLTDIPVGAYVLAAAFDIISAVGHNEAWARDFYRAASFTLIGGAAVSVLAALTGFWDWLRSTEPGTQARRTANAHAWTMITVTVIVLAGIAVRVLAFWDETSTTGIALAFTVAAAVLTALGGTIGGTLVFDYGFNVETAGDAPVWHRSEHDVLPGAKNATEPGTVDLTAEQRESAETRL